MRSLFQYVRNVVMIMVAYPIIGFSVAVVSSRFQTSPGPVVPQICVTPLALSKGFSDYLYAQACVLGWLTVVLYVVVFIALKKIDRSNMTAVQQTQMKQQSKATVTVMIVGAVSFVRL